ncbi:MAG: antirestriction protein ArdA [Myxococcales bacterium]|nr:antirestriction protein ArdA [Myxococcales bacterium]
MDSGPRIYVACLASYNAGRLHGRWLEAAQELDDLREEIRLMLEESPVPHAEEWAIHDHEGFSPISIGEYEDLEQVTDLAKLIVEHGPIAAHVVDSLGGLAYLEEASQALQDNYIGSYGSLSDWIEECLDEGIYGPVNEKLRRFLDTERMGREAEIGGDIQTFEVEGQVHLLWSR